MGIEGWVLSGRQTLAVGTSNLPMRNVGWLPTSFDEIQCMFCKTSDQRPPFTRWREIPGTQSCTLGDGKNRTTVPQGLASQLDRSVMATFAERLAQVLTPGQIRVYAQLRTGILDGQRDQAPRLRSSAGIGPPHAGIPRGAASGPPFAAAIRVTGIQRSSGKR